MQHEVTILTDDDYDLDDDIAPEYDLAAMREAARKAGFETRRRFVRLAPDVAAAFPNEEAVNQALRELIAARAAQTPPNENSSPKP
jgi:hypothetical protein